MSCSEKKSEKEKNYDSLMSLAIEKWKADTVKAKKIKPIGTGKITTIADGFDVKIVNVWSSTNPASRVINGTLKSDEKILIVKEEDPYYFIQTEDGKLRGYLMKGFVRLD